MSSGSTSPALNLMVPVFNCPGRRATASLLDVLLAPLTSPRSYTDSMKLRPLLVIAAVAAFFAALARKRVEEAKPTESWEPVSYS